MTATMTSRERVLAAMTHRQPDRVPYELSFGVFTPALMEQFRARTGATDPADYFHFDTRDLAFRPPAQRADYSAYYDGLPASATVDAWGVARVPGSLYHFTHMVHPMARFTSPDEVMAYPLPDWSAPECHAHFEAQVQAWHARGLAVNGELACTIFEAAWYLRGMENLLTDFATNPDLATALLDRLAEMRCAQARRYVEAGVDVLRLGDDIAGQHRLLMRPAMWRTWLRPRLARVIAAARAVRPDILIFYHTDGNATELVPDLMDVGVDILNPLQPECMDVAEMKRQYGQKLAFWGTVGTQTTMPHATPAEVRQVVRQRIATVGTAGGLLLAPTHILEPDVPWENILAFFEGIEMYGRYTS